MPFCSCFGPDGSFAVKKRVKSLVSSCFAGLTENEFLESLSATRVRKIEELNVAVDEYEKAARYAAHHLMSASVGSAAHLKVCARCRFRCNLYNTP
jgi:hypothetical protein